LDDYLNDYVFSSYKSTTEMPDESDSIGFKEFMKLYKNGLAVEKSAGQNI